MLGLWAPVFFLSRMLGFFLLVHTKKIWREDRGNKKVRVNESRGESMRLAIIESEVFVRGALKYMPVLIAFFSSIHITQC